jgi:Fic family protein
MVRKVRKNNNFGLRREVETLKARFGNLINVSNAEWYSLFKDEIRNSIAIEGVFANRQELLDVLENNKRTDKQKAASILGYFEAASAMYEYANNQFKENEFELRMADIKQIHTLLMRYEKNSGTYIGEIGDFRKNNIQVAHATFKPVDVFYIRPAMQLFIKWFNESVKKRSYDEVTLAAMAHVWFETIHPFSDGNGRAGRILLSYILIGQGLLNVAIKGISKQERGQYYDCLEKADACFESVHQQLENGKKIGILDVNKQIKNEAFGSFVDMIAGLMKDAVGRLKGGRLTNMSQEAVLPLRDLARVYDYSQDYLRNLINRGHLKARKKGKLWYVRVQDLVEYMNTVSDGNSVK